ncbi:PAS domain-containing sensor histidine kinase [Caloramator proteoclasticus]|uniref:histidine kinase n=1 Tax=Caloramator proteoclasticus DSM 10124 TaxID=1121262 RepID=A0A1M4X3T9_9CLOT|nr:PAS domain-containing sensor histidine kinase [Caloramator proteoclasticus]SHE88109.1 His Kinase A (phospho-acceptor) domain-containing protein [Caloramator proteoclasticus DSM 10124]
MEGLLCYMKNKANKMEKLLKPLINLIIVLGLIKIGWGVKLDVFVYILNLFYIILLHTFNSTYLIINAVVFSLYFAINTLQTGIRYDLIILNLALPIMYTYFHNNHTKNHISLSQNEAELLTSALDNIHLPLMLLDNNGQVVKSNISFKNIVGYDIDYKNLLSLVEDIDVNELNKTFYNSINKRIPSYTRVKVKSLDDEEVTLLFHPLSYFNKNLCLCLMLSSTNKNIADDMKSIIDNLYKNEQNRSEFYANLAHELRTPLNVILASMQMLNYINQDTSANKYMQIMKQNCLRLLRLINNLIDATKIDANFLNLNLNNYNIVNIVENIVQSVVDYAKTQGIDIIFDTDEEEVIVACDPDKIERIVLNLLSNAIKFTPQGGNIIVYVKTLNEYVKVSVKDTGCGIPKEKIETIFDRYRQIENNCKKCGSGIGLSLVKSLTELHGGFVEVESVEGEGSTFSFAIPIKTIDTVGETEVFEHNMNVEKIEVEFSDIYS